jgi:teichuronic acid biosynthesis glycosyltransferase TuaH
MDPGGIDHFIVSGTNWDESGPLMRRNRLAAYLKSCPSTNQVFWVGGTEIGPRRLWGQWKALRENTKTLGNGIRQISLPEHRGWFRYGSILNPVVRRHVRPFLRSRRRSYLWYTNPSYSAIAALFDRGRVVYDCSDYWNRPPTSRRKLASERSIVSGSGVVFCTSEFLVELVRSQFNREPVLIENGVDYGAYDGTPAASLSNIPRPRIGFIGGLKAFVDYRLLAEVIKELDGVNLVMMGRRDDPNNAELRALLAMKRVHYVEAVSSSEVPAYMKALDVGLLPYRSEDAFTAGVFPLKFFEYLAAGVPVVGYGVPATRKYAEEGVYYWSENLRAFLDGCRAALKVKDEPLLKVRRGALAMEHDWSRKFETMVRMVLERECDRC